MKKLYCATVIDRTGECVRVESFRSWNYAICKTVEACIIIEHGNIQQQKLVLNQDEAMALCHALRKAFEVHDEGDADAEK